jgi:hypothetical protein
VLGELRRRFGVEEASRRFLLYFVVPLWIGAGLADWWRHRQRPEAPVPPTPAVRPGG